MTTPWEKLGEFGVVAVIAGLLLAALVYIIPKLLDVVTQNTRATTELVSFLRGNSEHQGNVLNSIQEGVNRNILISENILDQVARKGG